jgi:hypothetical protein
VLEENCVEFGNYGRGRGGVAKGNVHVIVFVESVVWRYAAFYRGGG